MDPVACDSRVQVTPLPQRRSEKHKQGATTAGSANMEGSTAVPGGLSAKVPKRKRPAFSPPPPLPPPSSLLSGVSSLTQEDMEVTEAARGLQRRPKVVSSSRSDDDGERECLLGGLVGKKEKKRKGVGSVEVTLPTASGKGGAGRPMSLALGNRYRVFSSSYSEEENDA